MGIQIAETSSKLSIRPELLPDGRGARVLDVGCGDGRHILEAAHHGCFAVGLDYDAVELRKARLNAGGERVDLVAGDATRLPFRDGVFAAAICTETLEHLPDDDGALSELARILRPGGALLGAVPSHFTEIVFWGLSWDYWHTEGGHVRIYRPRALKSVLAKHGLQVEGLRYVHFIDSLIWLRFTLTDFVRPRRRRSAYEQAVLIAVAQQQPTPGWRTTLRRALPRSRLIAAIDAAGASVWPKSLTFVARKR